MYRRDWASWGHCLIVSSKFSVAFLLILVNQTCFGFCFCALTVFMWFVSSFLHSTILLVVFFFVFSLFPLYNLCTCFFLSASPWYLELFLLDFSFELTLSPPVVLLLPGQSDPLQFLHSLPSFFSAHRHQGHNDVQSVWQWPLHLQCVTRCQGRWWQRQL